MRIAVNPSTLRSINMGTDTALIAKAHHANMKPTAILAIAKTLPSSDRNALLKKLSSGGEMPE